MTKTEARKTLGITSSTSRSKTELIYTEKCKKLRLQMVPGIPETTRHNAYDELAKVTTAWLILQAAPAAPRYQRKQTYRKPPTRRSTPAKRSKQPQTLGEAWEELVAQMPFSEPVTLIILILVGLLFLILLASAF